MKTLNALASLLTVAAVSTVPVASQSLTTTTAAGNSGATGWTNQFDITVLNPAGVLVTAVDVNCENTRSGGVGSAFTIDVWVTAVGGTYLGNETNPAGWTKISQGASVSLATGTLTPVDVADFKLPPGKYGMALEYNGTAMAYTNGSGANQSYANADIQLDLGSSTSGLFTGAKYTPRVWNGTVHYIPGGVGFGKFGSGCAGTAGVPVLDAAAGSAPRLGTTFTTEISNLAGPGTVVIVGIGVSKTMIGGNPLPLDLSLIGAPGCLALTSTDATLPTASTGTTAQLNLPIPNIASLAGAQMYMQAFVVDIPANTLGLITTNGGTAFLGK